MPCVLGGHSSLINHLLVNDQRMGAYGSVYWCRCWTSHEASPAVSDPQSGVTLWTLQENDGDAGPFTLL